jgi:hypothetical protein
MKLKNNKIKGSLIAGRDIYLTNDNKLLLELLREIRELKKMVSQQASITVKQQNRKEGINEK